MTSYIKCAVDQDVLFFLGEKLGTDWNDALKKCSNFAYRDMCRTIKYIPGLKGDSQTALQGKSDLKKATLEIIQRNLLVPASEAPQDYDTCFYETCREIIKLFENKTIQNQEGNSLYFGQVQKWVNMFMKNLFAYCQVHGDNRLDKIFPYMHIPIDSVIVDILADKKTCPCDEGKGIKYGVKKPDVVWSQFGEQSYEDYQKAAKAAIEKCFPGTDPLRWEFQHWSSPDG